MKRIFTLIVATGLLCSCQSDEKEIYSRSIDVVSIPEGAPIIVDGLKIGSAPLSIGVETNEDGYFVRKTVITAIPQKESLHTQIISFPEYTAADPEKSRVPEKIIFHMENPPSQGGGVTVEHE
jgi:hypothetical protein